MDRKNVSNAYIAGMGDDLSLKISYRYSLITLVFFITYVIFQPPMTYLCRKVRIVILQDPDLVANEVSDWTTYLLTGTMHDLGNRDPRIRFRQELDHPW